VAHSALRVTSYVLRGQKPCRSVLSRVAQIVREVRTILGAMKDTESVATMPEMVANVEGMKMIGALPRRRRKLKRLLARVPPTYPTSAI
jgi:hypothetical protein